MSADLVLEDARLPGTESTTTVGISDGEIDAVGDGLDGDASIDAGGGLVTGGFVDCHVHLDKAFIAESLPPNESGTLREAIENIHARKAEYTVGDVRDRAIEAIEAHVRRGCTRIRTHVDVDPIGGLTPLDGVAAARDACRDIAEVQIVAFPQEGIEQAPGTADLLAEALAGEADLIGGMPDNERTAGATRTHVDRCLDLAREHDVDVDMHVDETDDPSARSLEYLAAETIDRGIEGRVTAGHTCALAAYDDPHASRVIDLVRRADLRMVTNPPTNLLLQGRADTHPKRRGITRVDELLEAGLVVAAGQDCLADGFYPYGRASMLETGLLTAHAAHLQTPGERDRVWSMITDAPAAIMGVDHGLEVGAPATLNVFDPAIQSRSEALRLGRPPTTVIHEGDVVATADRRSTLHRS